MSGEAGMGREKRGKQTLRKKMMVVMLISAMSSILAVVIVSYMTIRMIRNDSIQESMQIYLEQITRETDSAYYDMISIVNQMSPSGLIGNVVESYLSAEDNFDKYTGQKSLREELVKLGYVNTKLLGVTYYDLEEQSELIRNINVRNLDQVYQTIPNVTENIGNTIQAMHSPCLGIRERPVISVKRRVSFSNRQKLDIYAEIEPDMSVAERLNKENWKYTYMELDENGIVQRALRETRKQFTDLYYITDVCMCEYTSHGHCGVLCGHEVENDATLELLAKTALSHVEAGADMVAPSDMMDGRVRAIRECLDGAGHKEAPIMSYAVKYASAFYGPFRDAAGSAPSFGDRKSYQMDYHNRREGMKEALTDIEEGADIIIMVECKREV